MAEREGYTSYFCPPSEDTDGTNGPRAKSAAELAGLPTPNLIGITVIEGKDLLACTGTGDDAKSNPYVTLKYGKDVYTTKVRR